MAKEFSEVFNKEDQFKKDTHIKSVLLKDASSLSAPVITVAIPTYCRANTLRETLDSVLSQKDADDIEIMVVDNNPVRHDETELLMAQYDDSRIRYFKNEENLGMTGNWNRLYVLARGQWVCMLHDDDCLLPGYVANVKMLLEKLRGKADALFFTSVYDRNNFQNRHTFTVRKANLWDVLPGNSFGIAGNVLRKNTVIRLGGFNDAYYPGADCHFWFKLVFYARPYFVGRQPLVFYRIGENASCKTESLLGFIEKGDIYRLAVIERMGVSQKYLWKNYLYIFDLRALKRMSQAFNNDSTEIKRKIEDLSKNRSWEKILSYDIIRSCLQVTRFLNSIFKQKIIRCVSE